MNSGAKSKAKAGCYLLALCFGAVVYGAWLPLGVAGLVAVVIELA